MLTAILADDEEIVRSSMEKWIPWKELGIKLAGIASDGAEALDLIKRLRPDIVITDIRMPRLDGLELIKQVHDKLKDTEFIILSGFSEFEYAQKAMGYGVKHYLLKPARKEDLKEHLLSVKAEITAKYQSKYSISTESKEKYDFYLQRGMMMEVLSDASSTEAIIDRSRRLSPFDPDAVVTPQHCSAPAPQPGRSSAQHSTNDRAHRGWLPPLRQWPDPAPVPANCRAAYASGCRCAQ